MSVINHMLSDLDQRWDSNDANTAGVELKGTDGADSVPVVKKVFSAAMAFAVVYAVGLYAPVWFHETDSASQPQWVADEENTTVAPADVILVSAAPSAETVERVTDVAVADVEVESALISTPQIAAQIDQLMRAADAALLMDRLTTPDHDNAYDRYLAVLSLAPEHQGALTGVETIQQRYLSLLDKAIANERRQQVPRLMKKAQMTGVSQAALDERVAYWREKLLPQSNADQQHSESLPMTTTKPMVVESQPSREVNQPSSAEQSTSSKQSSALAKIEERIQRGQLQSAQHQLKQFLKEYPGSVVASELLFDVYFQQGQMKRARTIAATEALPALKREYLLARVEAAEASYESAMHRLQSHSPDMLQYREYYALLAAVYHKLQRYELSAEVYGQLTSLKDAEVSHWLGLAVSLDELQDDNALTAYQKVQQLADDNEAYRPFVDGRVAHWVSQR